MDKIKRHRAEAFTLEDAIDGAAVNCAIDGESPEELAILHLNLLSPEDKKAVNSLLAAAFSLGINEGRAREQHHED